MRDCAGCTLCCKLLAVPELSKAQDQNCIACEPGKGCRIHDLPSFPKSCTEFNCLWKQGLFPDEWRPDKTGVVFGSTTDGENLVAYVRGGEPVREKTKKVILESVFALRHQKGGKIRQIRVFLVHGKERRLMM